MTQSSVLTQHGVQTASSSTTVCIKACSAVSDACKVECENDPSCLQECSIDYDECVNDCGQNALKDRNFIASVANSTNSEKDSCMMECSVEKIDCIIKCQTDISEIAEQSWESMKWNVMIEIQNSRLVRLQVLHITHSMGDRQHHLPLKYA